ncbi:hypothetical protein DACRYDRAFT_22109, partial [Dacryopinax primogenitus]
MSMVGSHAMAAARALVNRETGIDILGPKPKPDKATPDKTTPKPSKRKSGKTNTNKNKSKPDQGNPDKTKPGKVHPDKETDEEYQDKVNSNLRLRLFQIREVDENTQLVDMPEGGRGTGL